MSVARFRPSLSLREAAGFVAGGWPRRRPHGSQVETFEAAFGREIGGGQTAVLAPSGRIALYWLLSALDLAPGAEVVLQAFNFTAVPAAVEALGARPRFVDLRPDSFEMDPDALARAIGPRTGAVLLTHLYGNPADLAAVADICSEHNVPLIEDCAQAVGASFQGRRVGTFGVGSLYTFGPTKNFTLLGGGAAASGDPRIARRLRELARRHPRTGPVQALQLATKAATLTLATSPLWFELAVFPAIRLLSTGGGDPVHKVLAETDSPLRNVERYPLPSARMAAVGMAQLCRYDELNRARERNGWHLYERLRPVDGIGVPLSREGNIFLSFPVFHPRRLELAAALRSKGVDTDLGFMCDCAAHPMFAGSAEACPHAQRAAREIVHLPVHPYLGKRDLETIVDGVREAVARVG